MKYILLPTDFSDNAWNAIFTALKLHKESSCHFYIFHAYEPEFTDLLGKKNKKRLSVLYESMEKFANAELDKVLQYLGENHHNSNHTFEKLCVGDDLIDAIRELISKKDIDLIVMGTQGMTSAKDLFMGSNTVRVIKSIRNCPVLAVPESHDLKALGQVVFPTDYSNPFNKLELRPLFDIMNLWQAEVHIILVGKEFALNEQQAFNKQQLSKRLEGIAHHYHNVPMNGNVAEAISNFAENNKADIIALLHYRHTFLEKLTREPVVKKMAFQTKVPLLVLPEFP